MAFASFSQTSSFMSCEPIFTICSPLMLAIFFISGTASIKVSILNCPALYAEFTELCPLPAIVPPVAKIVIFGKSAAFAIETPRPNKVHRANLVNFIDFS